MGAALSFIAASLVMTMGLLTAVVAGMYAEDHKEGPARWCLGVAFLLAFFALAFAAVA